MMRVLRAEREWSQADLAERLHVSRQTINAIETGKYDPSLSLAFNIAKLFDMSRNRVPAGRNRAETGVTASRCDASTAA